MTKNTKPAFIAVFSIFILPIALLLINFFPSVWVFYASIAILVAYFSFIALRYNLDKTEVALNFMTSWSFIVLMLLVENLIFRYVFIFFPLVVFFFIAYWSRPQISHGIHVKEKPLRRMMMMLYVFNTYAFFIGAYAWHLYFPNYSFVLISSVSAVYSALAAYMIWSLYFKSEFKKLLIWSIIFATVIFELMWVLVYLPFGYLAFGLLTVWIWYLLQLFVRFHLTKEDIVWEKQIGFLALNLILYIFVLFTIRWV